MPPQRLERLASASLRVLTALVLAVPTLVARGGSQSEHWAFRPILEPRPPTAKDGAGLDPIDRFVRRRLEDAGLSFSPPAARGTLLRRAHFDLTGLLPAPEETLAFLADDEPEAWEKLVDRLLASPRYSERWARHWLDVARYADTKGYVFQEERRYPYSYTYRDWVVDAFDHDKPFDRFIVEQIAADRMDSDDKAPLAALGYLTLGRRFLNNSHDIIDDRIDVVTRGFLGLTVQCARCHDHKYDPIPTEDYYSLYGVFASSEEPGELPEIGRSLDPEARARFEAELAAREAEVEKVRRDAFESLRDEARQKTESYLLALVGEEVSAEVARPPFLEAWRSRIAACDRRDPIFGAWQALVSLESEGFALSASAAISAPEESWSPLVLDALRAGPLETRADLARAYARMLLDADGTTPHDRADREALRVVLRGESSPLRVEDEKLGRLLGRDVRERIRDRENKVAALHAAHDGAPPRAMVLVDRASPSDSRVLLRGKPGNHGEVAPRRFLAALSQGEREPFRDGSGRYELALSIASPENPLTARVHVNRVFRHLFGEGIVRTPSDFGLRSDPPSHPELLDWLAARFLAEGWSTKRLVRSLLLSRTWRQSSAPDETKRAVDPENRLLWRMNPRRLEFEPLRDELLQVAGRLDMQRGGKSVDLFSTPFVTRRALWGFIDRQNLPDTFRTFDLASPDATSPGRHETIVPQQSLWLLNNEFATEQARLAGELVTSSADSFESRVEQLYLRLLCRRPASEEIEAARAFVERAPDSSRTERWTTYVQALLLTNEFLFVD